MRDRYDVAVIGAGMLGASAAYRLACAGQRVLLIEA
ncbi:MAG: FAD-dependent oxidoreductase, partial [Dehalococcoidia bacterium]